MRGGDRLIAGIELGCVEDFESATAADGGRIRAEDGVDEAIERAGGDALAGAMAHFLDGVEEAGHVIAGLRGDEGERGVIEEKEFGADALHEFVEEFFSRTFDFDEVPFVDRDDAGLAGFLDLAGDFFVLRGDALCSVDYQDAEIGAADAFFRAHDTEDFDGVIDLTARADTGGVDEDVGLAAALVGDVDGVARGAGDGADEGAAVLEDAIDEGGFADVRATDDGELDGCRRGGRVGRGRRKEGLG